VSLTDKALDTVIAAVGGAKRALLVVSVFLVALLIWNIFNLLWSGTRHVNDQFYDTALNLCSEASKVAASIATNPTAKDVSEKIARFEELFWGQLVVIEDPKVESAMVRFRTQSILNKPTYDNHELATALDRQFTADALSQGNDFGSLKQRSLAISMACHDQARQSPLGQFSD
jgi:hypothetical protein